MDKQQVAAALRETGLLLKAKGENSFKAKAYLSAAKTVQRSQEDLAALIAENRLTELPGIGESIEKYITELCSTGEARYLSRLRQELPKGAAELSLIRGLTLKRIQTLNEKLDISNIQQLEQACKEGKLANLKGFGLKVQNDILQALSGSREEIDQIRLVRAFELVDEIVETLSLALKTEKIEVVGAVRRWHETVDRITIIVESDIKRTAAALKKVRGIVSIEETGALLLAHLVDGIPLEVYPVANLAFGLLKHTGNKAHFEQLQQHAAARNLELDEANFSSAKNEKQIFKAIGLHFIPPEIREGRGEVAASKTSDFSTLVEYKDIRGMTHCHSTYSDGNNTIEQMALAAQRMGMEYITITDHSPTAHYAGGLSIDRLKEQWEEIDQVQQKVKIKLLKGTECDILADSKLDYPDHILEQFDIIIASIHSRYRQDEEAMTRRLLNGLKNPHFKIWGHPLGRITLHRDPIPCDVVKILEAIADAKVAIEINGDPYRMDLAPNWAAIAKDLGLKFIISTDAHSRTDYRSLQYGIHMARRALIKKEQVLNTFGYEQFCFSVKAAA
ncbi:MAG TPA: PHP domain-containing protein [Planktothrix sp.]|jgi:DNA polymerase (family 10)